MRLPEDKSLLSETVCTYGHKGLMESIMIFTFIKVSLGSHKEKKRKSLNPVAGTYSASRCMILADDITPPLSKSMRRTASQLHSQLHSHCLPLTSCSLNTRAPFTI